MALVLVISEHEYNGLYRDGFLLFEGKEWELSGPTILNLVDKLCPGEEFDMYMLSDAGYEQHLDGGGYPLQLATIQPDLTMVSRTRVT